jgi:hypothetical protein
VHLAASQRGGVHVLDGAGKAVACIHCGEPVSVLTAVAGAAKARMAASTATGRMALLGFE